MTTKVAGVGGLGCTAHLDPREKEAGNRRRLGEVRTSVLFYSRGLNTAPELLRAKFTHGKTPTQGGAPTLSSGLGWEQ